MTAGGGVTPLASGEAWYVGRSSMGIRPVAVLCFSIAGLVIGNLGQIPLLNLGQRSAPLLINDLFVGFTAVVAMLACLQSRSFKVNDVVLGALLFISIGAASAFGSIPRYGLTPFEVMISLAYLARWTMYFTLYLVVLNFVRESDVVTVWSALERAVIAIAGFGVFQSIFLPGFAQMVYPDSRLFIDWDPQGHRLVSTILEPNMVAAMILSVLMVQLAQLAAGAEVKRWKPALLLLALILTLSRSGALAFFMGLSVIVLVRGLSKRLFWFGAAAFALGLAGLPRLLAFAAQYSKLGLNDPSAMSRIEQWTRAIQTYWTSPWFGIGFNTYGFVQEHFGALRLGATSYSTEGGLLFVAVMTGAVGVAVYGWMLWRMAKRCRAVWRDRTADPSDRALCIGTVAATVAVLVHSIFANSLLMPLVMECLWVLWGLTFLVERNHHRQGRLAA